MKVWAIFVLFCAVITACPDIETSAPFCPDGYSQEVDENGCMVRQCLQADICWAVTCSIDEECLEKPNPNFQSGQPGISVVGECVPICSLPPTRLSFECMGHVTMYTYNSQEGRCEEYIYGGCMGTANRYKTMEACRRQCVCPQLLTFEHCPYGFLQEMGADGCLTRVCGEEDPCETIICPEGKGCIAESDPKFLKHGPGLSHVGVCNSICELPPSRNPMERCAAEDFPKYFHNPETGECETFLYTCHATENLFDTLEDCNRKCMCTQLPTFDHCPYGFSQDVGADGCLTRVCAMDDPCESMVCPEGTGCIAKPDADFLKGGSGLSHVGTCTPICELPPSRNPMERCAAENFPKYFHNPETRKCESFLYICHASENLFNTFGECNRQCTCPPTSCSGSCEFGFKRDENACDTCDCKEQEE